MDASINPRWGGVSRPGEYAKAGKSASLAGTYSAGTCSFSQNVDRTFRSKWHKSDTSPALGSKRNKAI